MRVRGALWKGDIRRRSILTAEPVGRHGRDWPNEAARSLDHERGAGHQNGTDTVFDDLEAAQKAIDGWVAGYNQRRPHQLLDMAVPADLFRPADSPLLPLKLPGIVAQPKPPAEPSVVPVPLPVVLRRFGRGLESRSSLNGSSQLEHAGGG